EPDANLQTPFPNLQEPFAGLDAALAGRQTPDPNLRYPRPGRLHLLAQYVSSQVRLYVLRFGIMVTYGELCHQPFPLLPEAINILDASFSEISNQQPTIAALEHRSAISLAIHFKRIFQIGDRRLLIADFGNQSSRRRG